MAADWRRNNPDKHNFYCKRALPLLEMEPDEWWKSQSVVQTCTISRRGGWGGSALLLFSASVPFFTFLCSPYHLLRRLKYFITSWFVYSKLCLFWYQYQRKWRLLLFQLADLYLWPRGTLFSTSACNWRLKEKKNQPAFTITQAETVKMHHR